MVGVAGVNSGVKSGAVQQPPPQFQAAAAADSSVILDEITSQI